MMIINETPKFFLSILDLFTNCSSKNKAHSSKIESSFQSTNNHRLVRKRSKIAKSNFINDFKR